MMKDIKYMKIKINVNEEIINKFNENLKKQLFFLYYMLLKNGYSNYYFEVINIILQYSQILSYPLGKTVRNFYNIYNSLIQYFKQKHLIK